MYHISQARTFRRSLLKLKRSGMFSTSVAADLRLVVDALRRGRRIPTLYRDHALAGHFSGLRECHIKGDLLLVYQRDDKERIVDLVNIGTHSQIFG